MSVSDLIRRLAAAGAPSEAIAIAIEALEAALEGPRRVARERKQRQRANVTGQSRDSHGTKRDCPVTPLPPSEEPASSFNTENNQPLTPPPYSPPALPKPNGFARFWEAYPNKVGRRAAETAYQRALRRADAATILAGLGRAALSRTWQDGFIPHPTTWLNQDRWLDEPDNSARAPPMSAGIAAAMAREEGRRMFIQRMEREEGEADQQGDSGGDRGVVVSLPDARPYASRA